MKLIPILLLATMCSSPAHAWSQHIEENPTSRPYDMRAGETSNLISKAKYLSLEAEACGVGPSYTPRLQDWFKANLGASIQPTKADIKKVVDIHNATGYCDEALILAVKQYKIAANNWWKWNKNKEEPIWFGGNPN